MEERLHKALGEFIKLAKRGGYTEGQVLSMVKESLLQYCHEQPVVKSEAEVSKEKKEAYMKDVFAFSISRQPGCLTRPKMEKALRVLYILHNNDFTEYQDFRDAVSEELKMSPVRVDSAIVGVNSVVRSIAFIVEAYAKDMSFRWFDGSYQDRLSILKVIEQRIYDDFEKNLESG